MNLYGSFAEFQADQARQSQRWAQSRIPDVGIISQVLMPPVGQTRETHPKTYSVTEAVNALDVNYLGIHGDRHSLVTAFSTGRESTMVPRGTPIRNHRHVFAVSNYDCKVLSGKLGVPITPELLGANLVIEREDGTDFSLSALPMGTRMLIANPDTQSAPKPPIAMLTHYALQEGCILTGEAIANAYADRGIEKLAANFVLNSKDNRGIVCSVEYPVIPHAEIRPGHKIFFKFSKGSTR